MARALSAEPMCLGSKELWLCLSYCGAHRNGGRMGDGSLPHKQGEVTLPFGYHTCLTCPNDPVKVTPGISHKPVLTGAGYTTFLWLLCHQTLYNPLCGITRDRCQVNLFKHQRDTSCLHSPEPPRYSSAPGAAAWHGTELCTQLFLTSLLCTLHLSHPPTAESASSFHPARVPMGHHPPNPPGPAADAGCARCCRCPNATSHCLPRLFCHFARLKMIGFPFPRLLCIAAFLLYSWSHFCLTPPAFLNRPLLS